MNKGALLKYAAFRVFADTDNLSRRFTGVGKGLIPKKIRSGDKRVISPGKTLAFKAVPAVSPAEFEKLPKHLQTAVRRDAPEHSSWGSRKYTMKKNVKARRNNFLITNTMHDQAFLDSKLPAHMQPTAYQVTAAKAPVPGKGQKVEPPAAPTPPVASTPSAATASEKAGPGKHTDKKNKMNALAAGIGLAALGAAGYGLKRRSSAAKKKE